jgi:hypothetical protein
VTLSAPTPSAVHLADASHLPPAAAVIAALRARRNAGGALRNAFTSRGVRASLQTVLERYPTAARVKNNHPYQAWVAENRGPVVFIGGPASSPPRPGLICEDVAVYDLQIRAWSELFQSC